MATKKYLVPVDFSRCSIAALRYAKRFAGRRAGSSLLVLHVITESAAGVPFFLRRKFYQELEQAAREKVESLTKRSNVKLLKPLVVIVRSFDPAKAITNQARKSRVSMVIMGSHGRTGLKRLFLGSVAERTLRYARCPVLIVKS